MTTVLPAPAVDLVGRLPLVYFDHGYDAGYRQAVADLLRGLVATSEEFIHATPGRSDDLRKLVYAFEQHLEARISRMSPDSGFVEGGLGI